MTNDQMIPEGYALLVNQIQSITKSLNDDDQISVFTETDILIKALEKELIIKYKAVDLHKKIREYLMQPTKNRELRLAQKIKLDPETAIHYYDADIGNDQSLYYKKKEEQKILIINDKIRTLISQIIKDKLTDAFDF